LIAFFVKVPALRCIADALHRVRDKRFTPLPLARQPVRGQPGQPQAEDALMRG
jgi:hypothetical protein